MKQKVQTRILASAGFPVTLAQLVSSLLMYTPILILQGAASPSAIGQYSAAAYLVVFGHLVGSAAATIKIPSLRVKRDTIGVTQMARDSSRGAFILLLCGIVGASIAVTFGNIVLRSVYGEEFTLPVPVLGVLALSAAVAPSGYLGSTTLLLLNRYWDQTFASVLSLTLALAVGLILIRLGSTPILAASLSALVGNLVRTISLWSLAALALRGVTRSLPGS